MKTIAALIALTCLLGVASAFIGEGYSSSQLAFFNAPSSSTFEPNVQQYWGSYIENAQNMSRGSGTTDMDLFMNNFRLLFDTPLQLGTTSFASNVSTPALSIAEKNSQDLTSSVNKGFSAYQFSSSPAKSGSLTTTSGTGTPANDATAKMLSQNIMTFKFHI